MIQSHALMFLPVFEHDVIIAFCTIGYEAFYNYNLQLYKNKLASLESNKHSECII